MKIIKETNLIQIGFVLILALSVITIAPDMLNQPVLAQAETCPSGDGWVKVEGLSGDSYTYTAPEGELVAETCYKAGENVVYTSYDPPQKTVTITSTYKEELSHASFRLVAEEETPAPTPTEPTPMPTEAEPTPMPTDEEQESPAPMATTEEEGQMAPTPQPTQVDPPASGMGPSMLPPALFPILVSIAGIGLVSGLIFIGKKKTIFNK